MVVSCKLPLCLQTSEIALHRSLDLSAVRFLRQGLLPQGARAAEVARRQVVVARDHQRDHRGARLALAKVLDDLNRLVPDPLLLPVGVQLVGPLEAAHRLLVLVDGVRVALREEGRVVGGCARGASDGAAGPFACTARCRPP